MGSSFFYVSNLINCFLLLPLLLCHLIPLTLSFSPSFHILCHEYESYALLQFKESFIISNDACSSSRNLESWKILQGERADCCSWDGVDCDEDTAHIINLDLSATCLFGSLKSNSSLFRLVHLQRLNLAFNHFNSSQIPSDIGQLSRLTHLDLSYSHLSGQIPSEIFSNLSSLVSLDLSYNSNLHISSLTAASPHLKELHLDFVNISSTIPTILANFSSLESLSLSFCGLIGEFPIGIFHLPNLRILDLTGNFYLTGFLPDFQLGSHLQSLKLSNTNFAGDLPSSIGNLTYLKELELSFTNFIGQIPYTLGNLSNLVSFDLSGTHFSLPSSSISSFSWIGKLTKLSNLRLSLLNLNGHIPSWLMNLTQLNCLFLSYNEFTGPIPSSLANLTQINYLFLGGNELSGQIPIDICTLSSLSDLDLSSNELQGLIPSNFSQLNSLVRLDLYSNNLAGSVDLNLFFHLKSLDSLILSFNNLSCLYDQNSRIQNLSVLGLSTCNLTEFPNFLQNQDQLVFLDLSSNNINGQIPSWMCNISQYLKTLNLSHNSLTGFEQDLVVLQLPQLLVLDIRSNMLQGTLPMPPSSISSYLISHNNLSGEIPPLFCYLTSLETLDLSFNNFSGRLPQCLGGDSISLLDLRSNNFHGSIPSAWRNGCNLRMISISYNQLQGQIPSSLASCSSLELIDFGNNHIIDCFPSWLGSLLELRILILRSNGLYGVIDKHQTMGFSSLQIIDLSHNNFTGYLASMYFESWHAMKAIDASLMTYMKKGPSPDSFFFMPYVGEYDYSLTMYGKGLKMEYTKIPSILTAIDFSYNKFEGEIPNIIGNLEALYLLNLSSNMLSGHIPFSLSNLKWIECMDLSGNQLSGEIPLQLVQLPFLSSFNVSFNNLSGNIPQGKQFNTFDNESYKGNPELCGDPLTKKCEMFELMPQLPPSFAGDEGSESACRIKWMIVLMGYGSGLIVGIVAGNEVMKRKHDWFAKTFGRKQQRSRKRRAEEIESD